MRTRGFSPFPDFFGSPLYITDFTGYKIDCFLAAFTSQQPQRQASSCCYTKSNKEFFVIAHNTAYLKQTAKRRSVN